MATIEISYTNAFDESVYTFPDEVLKTRVKETLGIMKSMLTQPKKSMAKKATTAISYMGDTYKIMLNLV